MFDVIARALQAGGLGAVFGLMLIENLLPVIPSEVILPMAGFQAADGRLSAGGAVAAATLASVLGACAWYTIGWRLGLGRLLRWSERHGRWLTLSPDELRAADRGFRRWGALAVVVGRALPGVRGVVSIPAGVARLPPAVFLAACSVGSFAWSAMLVWVGWTLRAHFGAVARWLNPVTTGFLIVCALVYAVRVITFTRPAPH